jgi:cytochrome c-type biogenesis protein CcsB
VFNRERWIHPVLVGFFSLLSFSPVAQGAAEEKDFSRLETLAIQERGRIKPLHTFAEESVQYLTGKRAWNKQSAMHTVFSWLIAFDKGWPEEPFLLVDSVELRRAIGLDEKRRHFSPNELAANEGLKNILREALPKQRKSEPLSELEKKAVDLQSRRGMLEAIVTGRAWTVLPNSQNINQPWNSLRDLTDRTAASNYTAEDLQFLSQFTGGLLEAFVVSDAEKWNSATLAYVNFIKNELGRNGYASEASLKREVLYNKLRPFRWSWALYLLAFCLLTAAIVTKQRSMLIGGNLVLVSGFLMHTFGFGLRMLVAGRPPVTNMYESVIWVSWGCILFGMIISRVYKSPIINAAASVFAVVSLVLADLVPTVLDPSIQPLEPVLRSNFWLTVHVLTITLSYAAFALSLCLGNVVLGTYLISPQNIERVQSQSLYMYRAMQIGVILLAAGTILGGVWADYSWGRFWGWDPKEVWALIALLLYLAVLHGRFSGWLQGFGFTVGAVLSFLGVLMAWYGVNFVLGAGLHSYGFGSGGTGYMVAFVVAQLAFIGAAYYRYRQLDENTKKKTRLIVK